MNKLWAPWRMDYIRAPKKDGCIFCIKHQSKKDKEHLLLFRGKESFVLMNLYPYTNGHLMISPYKHTSDTNDISAKGNQEIMFLTNKSMKIIKNLSKSVKMYEINERLQKSIKIYENQRTSR